MEIRTLLFMRSRKTRCAAYSGFIAKYFHPAAGELARRPFNSLFANAFEPIRVQLIHILRAWCRIASSSFTLRAQRSKTKLYGKQFDTLLGLSAELPCRPLYKQTSRRMMAKDSKDG